MDVKVIDAFGGKVKDFIDYKSKMECPTTLHDFRLVLFQLIEEQYLEEIQFKNRVELRVLRELDPEGPFLVNIRDDQYEDETPKVLEEHVNEDEMVTKKELERTNSINDKISLALSNFHERIK